MPRRMMARCAGEREGECVCVRACVCVCVENGGGEEGGDRRTRKCNVGGKAEEGSGARCRYYTGQPRCPPIEEQGRVKMVC